jgi:hypothetical protein
MGRDARAIVIARRREGVSRLGPVLVGARATTVPTTTRALGDM